MLASLLLVCAPPLLIDGASSHHSSLLDQARGFDFRSSLVDLPAVSAARSLLILCAYTACGGGGVQRRLPRLRPRQGRRGLRRAGQRNNRAPAAGAGPAGGRGGHVPHVARARRRPPRHAYRIVYRINIEAEMAKKCYVVYIGRVPGVYEEWEDCAKQVNNFSGNIYQGYASREVAEEKWRRQGRMKWRNFIVIITALLLSMVGYVLYSHLS